MENWFLLPSSVWSFYASNNKTKMYGFLIGSRSCFFHRLRPQINHNCLNVDRNVFCTFSSMTTSCVTLVWHHSCGHSSSLLSYLPGIMQQFAISEATLFGWNSMDGDSMGAGSNQGSVAHLSEVNQESITSRGKLQKPDPERQMVWPAIFYFGWFRRPTWFDQTNRDQLTLSSQ